MEEPIVWSSSPPWKASFPNDERLYASVFCDPGDELISGSSLVNPYNEIVDDAWFEGFGAQEETREGWKCHGALYHNSQESPPATTVRITAFCRMRCGDGVINDGEQCDDWNYVSGDGCSGCSIDPGYYCYGEPSVCQWIEGSDYCPGAGELITDISASAVYHFRPVGDWIDDYNQYEYWVEDPTAVGHWEPITGLAGQEMVFQVNVPTLHYFTAKLIRWAEGPDGNVGPANDDFIALSQPFVCPGQGTTVQTEQWAEHAIGGELGAQLGGFYNSSSEPYTFYLFADGTGQAGGVTLNIVGFTLEVWNGPGGAAFVDK
ncbi:MAG: DUF4215 domain-containing protein [Bradymonadales bacterium]|nr:DUF4215 domain-containing protein [Bradymonadales bacterium]